MKYIKMLVITLSIMLFTGCYEQVPAGHVGKILGKNGFQPEVYPPSRVWLEQSFTITPEKLVLIETTTKKYTEPIDVLLKDKLNLKAEIVFRGRIKSDNEKILNSIFNDINVGEDMKIEVDDVYNIYGKMIVLNTAREIISKYNVDEINQNYARITVELYNALKPKLDLLPIEISDVTIGNIQYPEIVTKAIEASKEKRMLIEREEAEVQIRLAKAKGQEEIAKAEYNIKMMEAKRIRDYNKMISEGVTDNLLKLRNLEVQEKMVEAISNNPNVVYMPTDMMTNSNNMRIIK